MKELISILTAADEHFTLSERIIYGIVVPLAMILFAILVPALFEACFFLTL